VNALNKVIPIPVIAAILVSLLLSMNYISNSALSQGISTSTPNLPTNTSSDFIYFLIFIIIVAVVWELTHRSRKRKVFPQSVKQKTLEKQRHKCANCKRLLNVVDYHHKNGKRSDNKESNCVALCPNCHADTTRR